MTRYTVIAEAPDHGESWSAFSPDLHVYATADTREGVITEVTDAIAFHIAGLREDGRPIPAAACTAVEVTVTH